jgi:hypothetical protein
MTGLSIAMIGPSNGYPSGKHAPDLSSTGIDAGLTPALAK